MTKTPTRVAIVGHTQHGKTSLLHAIAQRVGRGGAASETFEYETPTKHVTLRDTRGGLEEVAQALSSPPCTGAVLVVTATDGVQAGTRDAVQAARQAGVRGVVVFVSKCDLVEDSEMLDLIEMEIREVLDRFKFKSDATPFVRGAVGGAGARGDSRFGEAVAEVLAAIDRTV
jgi:elongation factor Tu